MPESYPVNDRAPEERGLREVLLGILRPGRAQLARRWRSAPVGMAVVVQVRSNTAGDRYATMRRDDLIQLLDGLTEEAELLAAEVAELERTRDALQSGADAQQVAEQEAKRRADGLAILAGTIPATGPGSASSSRRPPAASLPT